MSSESKTLSFRQQRSKAIGILTSFFDSGEDEISSQPNRLIWGDNLLVIQALLAQVYEEQIDLIYIDPPFNTGEDFNFPNEEEIGIKNYEREVKQIYYVQDT